MKPPFNFGLRFFLRVLLPGFILALSVFPVAKTILDCTHITIENAYLLSGTTLLLGWWCSLMDMPIYMAFEGRTWFWLDRLRPVRRIQDYFIKKETTRLKELLNRVDNPVDDKDAREAATE